MSIDDALAIGIGDVTTCCQCLDAQMPGESSMMHSVTEKNGSVFIVEKLNEFGEVVDIVAQSWIWRNGDRLCFDNVEIPDGLIPALGREGAFDEILDVYQEAAKRMIETDTKALRKLLEAGKITKEQFDKMQISMVTAGTGCDNLISNISKERREQLEDASIILPIENGKFYTGMTTRVLYSDARRQQVVITDNPEKAKVEHNDLSVHELGVKYTKIREIKRRENDDINPDIIKNMRELSKHEGITTSVISKMETNLLSEYLESADLDLNGTKLSCSYSELGDWYILKREDEDSVIIEDSLIGSFMDSKNPKAAFDKKMSFMEYSAELLTIIAKAHNKNKLVKLDLEREGKLGILNSLIEKNLLSVEDGIVTVKNIDFLMKTIEVLNDDLDKLGRERLLSDIAEEEEEERE